MKKLFIILLLSGIVLFVFYVSIWSKNEGSNKVDQHTENKDNISKTAENKKQESVLNNNTSNTDEVLVPRSTKNTVTPDNSNYNVQQHSLSPSLPGSTVEPDTANNQAAVQVNNSKSDKVGVVENPSGKAATEVTTAVHSTPAIIPVEQAASFFVPKEQRAPGNLGGPPPLPSAASTPAMQGSLQPPAAPGSTTSQPATSAPAASSNPNPLTPPPAFQ